MLTIFMDPSLALWCLTRFVRFFTTFNSIQLVLSSVYLIVTVQLEFSADSHSYRFFGLLLNSRTFRYKLALEDTINSEAFISAY